MELKEPTPENQEEMEILRQSEEITQKARRGGEITEEDYNICKQALAILLKRAEKQSPESE